MFYENINYMYYFDSKISKTPYKILDAPNL